ncbi:MAG: YifB family Mg chelatase-like AAA ATPase [Fusobacteriaceae bacterium]
MNLKVMGTSYTGIENYLVEVEIDICSGLPNLNIIGMGDTTIYESRERVRTAMRNSDYQLPPKKITVNLSPASIRKVGSHFDLAISTGLGIGMGYIKDRDNIVENFIIMGELALNGDVKGIRGVIGGAILAKELGIKGIVVPLENLREARAIPGIDVIGVKNLKSFFHFISSGEISDGEIEVKKSHENMEILKKDESFSIDMNEIIGQANAKRALEISAAGGHNLLLSGSPGSGKSMLARRIETILPKMNLEEIIESSRIYSIMGELDSENHLVVKRPFRSPHHTGTITSIIGGGRNPKPGEITMAHNGVLFLDEMSEFSKDVIESLRQPLEDRKVSVSRTGYRLDFPTKFILIGATNPCNCGLLFEDGDQCRCSAHEIERYRKKLSGPIIDRMDLYVEIKKVEQEKLLERYPDGENSETIRMRVERARVIQMERYGKNKLNCEITPNEMERYCFLNDDSRELLKIAGESLKLTARAFHKVIRIARTIADLEIADNIEKKHILEALSFRKN